jgi:hypothetical protein
MVESPPDVTLSEAKGLAAPGGRAAAHIEMLRCSQHDSRPAGPLRRAASLAGPALLLAALVLGGCGRPEFSGFLEPYVQFHEVSKVNNNLEYVRPGVRWAAYNKVRIAEVLAVVLPAKGYRAVNPDEIKRLTDYFEARLVESLGRRFEMTIDPGADVLDVKAAVTRLRPTDWAANAVSWVAPGGFAVATGYTALTNSNLVLGEAAVEVELVDSVTGLRQYGLVALHLGSSLELEQLTRWGIAERALKRWAEFLADRIAEMEGEP